MKAQIIRFIKGKLHTQRRPNLSVYCKYDKNQGGREYIKEAELPCWFCCSTFLFFFHMELSTVLDM